MICTHTSIKRATYGSAGTCINCNVDIIHDGKKWRWLYDIDASTRRRMTTFYNVTRLADQEAPDDR